MSIAGAQALKFYEQVTADGKVFTFIEDNEYLVFSLEGHEVVPFWSSRTRVESIQKGHPKYQNFQICEMTTKSFFNDTLPLLEQNNIHVGINWSGKRLTGYDLPVCDLRKNLQFHLQRRAP